MNRMKIYKDPSLNHLIKVSRCRSFVAVVVVVVVVVVGCCF